jgi:hypothetical protein
LVIKRLLQQNGVLDTFKICLLNNMAKLNDP